MSCNDCRTVGARTYRIQDGTVVRVILRDAIVPEDPYLNLVRAQLYSIRTGEAFGSDRIGRTIKDSLIKTTITI